MFRPGGETNLIKHRDLARFSQKHVPKWYSKRALGEGMNLENLIGRPWENTNENSRIVGANLSKESIEIENHFR